MNAFDFSKLCKELHQLSETVTVEASLSYVKFSIEGEVGSGTIQIQTNDAERKEDSTKAQSFEKVVLSFALRYLNMFNKASTLCQFVKLMLAQDTPLVVEYEIDNMGSLKYYLAPKINENAE